MTNRLIRVVVIIVSFLFIFPSLALSIITYPLFNLNLFDCDITIFSNATFSNEWDYKTMFNYLK